MTDKNISMWKIEEFLIDNLKELSMGNGKFKLKAECSLQEFLEKFENYIQGGINMAQYIDKSAIVAEIEKRLSLLEGGTGDPEVMKRVEGVIKGYKSILSFLTTLETKGVDLEKELDKYTADNFWALEGNNESPYLLEKDDMLKVAKYFFELGLKAQKGE